MDQRTDQARNRKVAQKFAAWLAAGTITMGLGVAAISGTAVAYADTGASGTASHATSDNANNTATRHDSAGSPRKAAGTAAPRPRTGGPTAAQQRASLSVVPTAASSKTTAKAQVPTPQSVIGDISRQINYIFFNQSPKVHPTQNAQTGTDKAIVGALNATSNNGFGLTYTVTTKPKFGTVLVDPTGAYVYVARDALIAPGITDTFTIAVNNGADAKLPGVLGQVQLLLHSLAVSLGIAKPDTIEHAVTVKVTGTSNYGTPDSLAEYWQQQTIDNDCVLIAVASAVGQLKGDMPSEATIVDLAMHTTSVVNPPNPMYVGPKATTGFGGVDLRDAVALLKQYGLDAELATYVDAALPGEEANMATLADGARALNEVEASLAEGEAVIAIVNAQIIYTAAGNAYPTPFFEANHAILVTGVDVSTGKVYVNDGNLMTGSTAIPIGAFMWGWMGSDFNTIYASKPAQSAAAAAQTSIAA